MGRVVALANVALPPKADVRSVVGMSALGHKRTFAAQNGMSAFPPKADMCSALGMSAKCQ